MEFITRKALLFKGLQRVQGIADTKGAIPILSHVLIKAIDDQAWIFATDLKIGIKGSVPATVKREGRVTLPAKRIFDIVRELPDGDVLISTDTADQSTYENQWINVCAGNYRSKIPCMPPEIFPEFPSFDKDYIIRFKPEILKNMIRKTILATSNEEGRPALTGVLMEVDSDNAVFVSTDGHRLSFVRTENKTPTEKKHSLILPQKTCSELIKFIEPVDEDILFALYENQAVFRQGDLVLVSRLIEEGKYPRYEGVIPEKGESCAVLKKEELISSLKRVSVLAGEDSGMVRFCLRPNEVELSAQSNETGEALETLGAECQADSAKIGLNAKYALDFLSVIEEEEVVLFVKNPKKPALLVPKNSDTHKMVIMPMRLNETEKEEHSETVNAGT